MNKITTQNPDNPSQAEPYRDRAPDTPIVLQYWQAVLAHKIAIAIFVAVAVALGIVATLLMTPYYTSSSRIEINRSQDKVTNVEGLQSEDSGQSLEFYQTQYSLLEARSLANRVVRSKNLTVRDDFWQGFDIDPDNNGLLGGNSSEQSASDRARRLKLATDLLLDNLSIAPIRGSSLVDISFSSPSPSLSAEIANAWVEQFIESNLDRRFDSTSDARKFLEERLAELRQRLEDSERRLVLYADNKQIVTLSSTQDSEGKTISQKTLASSDLEALNQALAQATADRIIAESEVRQRRGNKNALENPALNSIRLQRATVESEYAKLLVQFEPEYPAAKALQSQIEALDNSIAREEARARTGTEARYSEASQRERELKRKVDELKGLFSGERKDSIQYNIFQREVDTNRQLYDGLLQRYKEIGVAGVGNNNIAVVDRASPADKPSSPRLLLNIVLSALAGVGLAAVYVFVMEQLDQTVKDSSDLKTKLGVVPLGLIPDLEKQDVLESLEDKKSVAWEAYLSIRTSLSFLTDHGVPRSFLVTSTRPNEGKSTSAFALAAVLTSADRKLLLVDGDMRNPSLHKMLGIQNEKGLSNYLSGDQNFGEAIKTSEVFGFDAMTAGPVPPNAAELLSSDRIQELMAELGKVYDTIIIDAPPVLGLADIPLLAGAVEGVIYTIEANGVKIKGIEAALQRIRASHAPIFGGIVTKVSSDSKGYGYGYNYEYSYGEKAPA